MIIQAFYLERDDCYSTVAIDFRTIATQKYIKYEWTITGHVTLPCEVYIFIFDSAWACLVSVVVESKTDMLVVVGSVLGQGKN